MAFLTPNQKLPQEFQNSIVSRADENINFKPILLLVNFFYSVNSNLSNGLFRLKNFPIKTGRKERVTFWPELCNGFPQKLGK